MPFAIADPNLSSAADTMCRRLSIRNNVVVQCERGTLRVLFNALAMLTAAERQANTIARTMLR